MKSLPVFNPQNRFASTSITYDDGEVPVLEGTGYEIFEDQTKNILASNDSPDVGFRWSVNPYRGCLHACAYCLAGTTPILMGDGSTRALDDVRVGDLVYGTTIFRGVRRYEKTRVRAHWRTMKRAFRVHLDDGTELIASGDHRFLSSGQWAYVDRAPKNGEDGPRLGPGDELAGVGALPRPEAIDDEYRRGYLDGWTACGVGFEVSLEMLRRIRVCLLALSPLASRAHRAFQTQAPRHAHELEQLVSVQLARTEARHETKHDDPRASAKTIFGRSASFPLHGATGAGFGSSASRDTRDVRSWRRGWLAAVFDVMARGRRGALLSRRIAGAPRLARLEAETIEHLAAIGIATERTTDAHGTRELLIRGGIREELRLLSLLAPCNGDRWSFAGARVEDPASSAALTITSIEDLGFHMAMVDITTGSEDFIANGVVSHNCYARPSHEYLSFGAGTDFERKIVVKPRAPELLRDAFEKKSWKGELIVFSGVTDCYQPIERDLELTRGCLEVCAEYKNPVGIITKSPVIERDLDVLQELARVASVRVSVSVPFWDTGVARAMEPMVTTPERRMRIIETLAKAGIRVGVSVSPIVPGLNDEHLGDVLERAADAGAGHCFFVLLRLPGAVKDVFEHALRQKLPLRAEKVLRRMREAHGGKVYDSRYGQRQHGSGPYADTISALFTRTAKRYGLSSDEMSDYEGWMKDATTFERPLVSSARAAKTTDRDRVRDRKAGQTSFGF